MRCAVECAYVFLSFCSELYVCRVFLSFYVTFLRLFLKILSFLFVVLKIMHIFVLLLNEDVSLIKLYDYGIRNVFFGSVGVFSSDENLYGVKGVEEQLLN